MLLLAVLPGRVYVCMRALEVLLLTAFDDLVRLFCELDEVLLLSVNTALSLADLVTTLPSLTSEVEVFLRLETELAARLSVLILPLLLLATG